MGYGALIACQCEECQLAYTDILQSKSPSMSQCMIAHGLTRSNLLPKFHGRSLHMSARKHGESSARCMFEQIITCSSSCFSSCCTMSTVMSDALPTPLDLSCPAGDALRDPCTERGLTGDAKSCKRARPSWLRGEPLREVRGDHGIERPDALADSWSKRISASCTCIRVSEVIVRITLFCRCKQSTWQELACLLS